MFNTTTLYRFYYLVVFYFCSTFLLFAQIGEGNGGTGNGALEGDGDTTPTATLDDYIWVLAIIALLFVFFKFRAIYRKVLR